jgi:filamentous hemagglutinin family protein
MGTSRAQSVAIFGKSGLSKSRLRHISIGSVSLTSLAWALGVAPPAAAQSLPTGGTVASGSVTISKPSSTSITINQSSATGIVNWSSFSIGQGHQAQFNNGTGATLNRVTSNVPSSIDGRLSATGSVYLVNPAGVAVGPTGVVKTGGSFVASTLDVKDANFVAGGPLTFSGDSRAAVVNLGKIGSSRGDVVLMAREVRNDGTLSARRGTAAMASGSAVVLSDGSLGNGKVLVRRPAENGEVRNSGAIRAAEVELRTNGGNIYALAGNTGRAIAATGIANKGGRLFLTAAGGEVVTTQKLVARRVEPKAPGTRTGRAPRSFAGGDVIISGDRVTVGGAVRATGRNGAGGTVVVTGTDVTLASGARVDARGTSGGTVLIGGDRLGGADPARKFLLQAIATARTTRVEAGASITADGSTGSGGRVVVWSDGTTSFAGSISAAGLRGGFIETSGHVLNLTGGRITAGKGGTWLLDPDDLTIGPTLASTIMSTLNTGTDVIQQTSASGTGGSGDITVASPISWTTSATLTLSAYRDINVNAGITSTGNGGVVLRADNTGTGTGTVNFGAGQITTGGGVSIFYNPAGNDATSVNATSYTTPTDYSPYVSGASSLTSAMLVNTLYDLQNIGNNLVGTYALSRNIDASSTAGWNSGAGFTPIGNSSAWFNGSFDGQRHTISGLAINQPGTTYVGLFGYVESLATLSNVTMQSASIVGAQRVGVLAGWSHGSISNASATGTVTAVSYGGGLVGENRGLIASSWAAVPVAGTTTTSSSLGGLAGWNNGSSIIQDSYATGNVTAGSGGTRAGGLTGQNNGVIRRSYATGAVSGGSQGVGGLVGYNASGSPNATITDSYATGAVTATAFAGGLVGLNSVGASVLRSYATGAVTVTSTTSAQAGGLIGSNAGIVAQSYATGAVSVSSTSTTSTQAAAAGGLIGSNTSTGTLTQSYATGSASVTTTAGAAQAGGLIGSNGGGASVAQSYSTGAAHASSTSGTVSVGGLIGINTTSSTVTASYWDTVTSGTTNGIGASTAPITRVSIAGLTTSQMQDPANYATNYAGFDFANTWSTPSAGYYPQLFGVNYVLRVDPANASRIYGNANPAFNYAVYGLHTGDTSSIVSGVSLSTTATTSSGVGSYAIASNGGGAISASGHAYRIINAAGALTITPRALMVAADAQSRVYGDANPLLTYRILGPGLINGDTLSGGLATAATATSNVGAYAISQGTLGNANYSISYTGANLAVTARPITVTADAQSRVYGDANPTLTYRIGGRGLANGDTLSGGLATAATATSNVGAYAITQGTLGSSANYSMSYTGANLAVTARPIAVTADDQSRPYGDANPPLTYRIGGRGLANGDTLSGGLATAATASSNAGAYAITQGTLGKANYDITYKGANLTVTARPVTDPPSEPKPESKPEPTPSPAARPIQGVGSYVEPAFTPRDASLFPSFETACSESTSSGCHRPVHADRVDGPASAARSLDQLRRQRISPGGVQRHHPRAFRWARGI